jgi:hypothetical protein
VSYYLPLSFLHAYNSKHHVIMILATFSYVYTIRVVNNGIRGLRQINNLKTIAKFKKYKMYGIDTSRDKPRDFDLVSLTF